MTARRTLKLDYPVSMNNYWTVNFGRVTISPQARIYKQHVIIEAANAGFVPSDEKIYMHIVLHPKLRTNGEQSKIRIDLDNCAKIVCDALNKVAYNDDKQIHKILMEIGEPMILGGLTVSVENMV